MLGERGRTLWPFWLALLAYPVVLVLLSEMAPAAPPQSERGLAPFAHPTHALVRDAAVAALAEVARFVPLGWLAVLALPRRTRRLKRLFHVFLPSVVMGVAIAAVVVGLEIGRPWALPSGLDMALPLLGCLLGGWLGLAWTKGGTAWLWFLPKLALLLALIIAGSAALLYRSLENEALDFEPVAVTSAEKRRLYRLFKERNPANLSAGRTAELRLTSRDLDLLLDWGLAFGGSGRKARVELGDDASTLAASIRLPIGGSARYLNLTASAEVGVQDGRPSVVARRLAIGRLETPRWLLDVGAPLAVRVLAGDRRVRPLLSPIQHLETGPNTLVVRYGHAEPPSGFLAELFRGERADEEDIPAIQAQLRNLIRSSSGPRRDGDARFLGCLQTAFRLAQERSQGGDAVRENRAAILALGMLLGHWRVETLVGKVIDPGTMEKAVRAFRGTTLRGRDDWPKHFFVSASLTVLAQGEVSDAAGLLKEEIDAGGGSGFSFADLLADRAGTTFAATATRDEETARAFQQRLARGGRTDDVFPTASGLPEGIQDAELQARYGGVGGEGYARLAEEVERRVSACPAYRR